jgi:hypothetical protein
VTLSDADEHKSVDRRIVTEFIFVALTGFQRNWSESCAAELKAFRGHW